MTKREKKILEKIEEELTLLGKDRIAKKILFSFKAWERLVEEENLMGYFCNKCKAYIDDSFCKACQSSQTVTMQQLPIYTIYNISYEVTEKVTSEKGFDIII